MVELQKICTKYILLDDICTYKNADSHFNLLEDPNYTLLHCNKELRNGFSVFKKKEDRHLENVTPIHFFTIVLNGMPFIGHHLTYLKNFLFTGIGMLLKE